MRNEKLFLLNMIYLSTGLCHIKPFRIKLRHSYKIVTNEII